MNNLKNKDLEREMDFFELITERRSVRKFVNKEIEGEKLDKILEAANLSPSAGNLQAYEILVVRNGELRQSLGQASFGQTFISDAPVIIVFCANTEKSARVYRERGQKLYSVQDATIAAAYVQLAAVELGLATVWIGAFDEHRVSDILDIPEKQIPVAIIPIGYPDEKPSQTQRRKIDDLVTFVE